MKKLDFKKAGTKILGIGTGVLAANWAGNKFLPNANDKLVGAGKIVLGAFLPALIGKKGGDLVENFGNGVIADGFYQVGNAFAPNAIKGYGHEQSVGNANYAMEEDAMAGADEYSDVLNKSQMNGLNEDAVGSGVGGEFDDE